MFSALGLVAPYHGRDPQHQRRLGALRVEKFFFALLCDSRQKANFLIASINSAVRNNRGIKYESHFSDVLTFGSCLLRAGLNFFSGVETAFVKNKEVILWQKKHAVVRRRTTLKPAANQKA